MLLEKLSYEPVAFLAKLTVNKIVCEPKPGSLVTG